MTPIPPPADQIPDESPGGARRPLAALFDQGVASGTNFAAGVIIGRTVAQEEFGLYVLGFSIVVLMLSVQTAAVSTPLTVLMPRTGPDERARLLGSTLVFHWGLALVSVGSLMIGAAGVSLFGGAAGLAHVLWALALTAAFLLLREYARRAAFATFRMGTAVALDCTVAVLQLGGLLALRQTGLMAAWRAHLAAGLAGGVAAVGWLAFRRGKISIRRADLAADLRRTWKLGRWVLASVAARTASTEVFPWLLFAVRGKAEVGVLGAASGIVFLANPFMIGMGNFLAPQAAHAAATGRRELRRIVTRMTLFMAFCLSLFLLAMFFAGGPLVALVYGARYAGYGLVVAVLALRYLIEGSVAPAGCALVALDRAHIVFAGNVAAGVAALLAGPLLASAYGVVGAAWAMAMTMGIAAAVQFAGYWSGVRLPEEQA